MAKKEKLSLEELLEQALVKDEDKPYEVPGNWVWTRLESVASWGSGGTPSRKVLEYYTGNIPWVKTGELNNGVIYTTKEKITQEAVIKSSAKIFPVNTIVIAMYGATIGKVAILGVEATTNQACGCGVCLKCLHYKYLFYYALSQKEAFIDKGKGGAQPNISQEVIKQHVIPLPPLPEQQRIVALIESLFKKLDRAKELAQNALNSFENRKSAILHKAFTGELTRKWREENRVDKSNDFYNIIREQRLIFARSSKEKKEITQLFDEYALADNLLDNGWIILKTLMFCYNITCGNTPTGHIMTEGDVPFLKVYNIVNNKIDFNHKPQFINDDISTGKLKSSVLFPNDVVMNIVGPPLRKIAIIPNDYSAWNMNQAIVRFRTVKYVDSKYLYYCLINKETLDKVISETKGVVGQANISITQSRNLEIPIPALQEQNEIVRILDNLLENEQKSKELCDVIDKIDHMKKSILARAFRGELSTNNPAEESALELLKEVLKEKV